MTAQLRLVALLCASLVLLSAPAAAELKVCNRTSYVLYTATATEAAGELASQGWTRVVPGDCQAALRGDLLAQSYYLYARSSQAHGGPARAWGGGLPVCVKDIAFATHQPTAARDCESDNFFPLPFAAIDTHRMKSWTTTLSETPAIATLSDAMAAGVRRLLGDLGYPNTAIAHGEALADFRKRQHLSPKASNFDVFDALETNALKVTAPAGYSICNDTANPLAAAIGQKETGGWTSHGWWKIAAGSCAKAITAPLATDSVYLFVQKVAGPALVSGREKFCVANIEFDIQGRTRCTSRGLGEAGFAQTRVLGLSGFAAHVGETGLVASRYRQMSDPRRPSLPAGR
jgi:uncharacterized membrane protein